MHLGIKVCQEKKKGGAIGWGYGISKESPRAIVFKAVF
jgi:hypothetical protein